MGSKIKIVLADDWTITLNAFSSILEDEDDFQVVGKFKLVIDLLEYLSINNRDVDLICLDLKWANDDTAGISIIKKVKNDYPKIKLLVITVYPSLASDARNAGADHILIKEFEPVELIQTIRFLCK